jgi:hypothetical protein
MLELAVNAGMVSVLILGLLVVRRIGDLVETGHHRRSVIAAGHHHDNAA